jgi:hypothetical protein
MGTKWVMQTCCKQDNQEDYKPHYCYSEKIVKKNKNSSKNSFLIEITQDLLIKQTFYCL